MQCNNGQVYQSCGSICEKTCFDNNESSCISNECIEGCFCVDGYVLNENGRCVERDKCSCKENGIIYRNNQIFAKKECEIW
jgi:hypothetical protein